MKINIFQIKPSVFAFGKRPSGKDNQEHQHQGQDHQDEQNDDQQHNDDGQQLDPDEILDWDDCEDGKGKGKNEKSGNDCYKEKGKSKSGQ